LKTSEKSEKITAQTADGENNKAKITFPENKLLSKFSPKM